MIMFAVNLDVFNICNALLNQELLAKQSAGKKCKYFINKQDSAEIQAQPHFKIVLLDLSSFRDQLFS